MNSSPMMIRIAELRMRSAPMIGPTVRRLRGSPGPNRSSSSSSRPANSVPCAIGAALGSADGLAEAAAEADGSADADGSGDADGWTDADADGDADAGAEAE